MRVIAIRKELKTTLKYFQNFDNTNIEIYIYIYIHIYIYELHRNEISFLRRQMLNERWKQQLNLHSMLMWRSALIGL